MATKIYIAGKITGDPDYKAKFNAAAEAYKKKGYTVLNPSWMPQGMQKADYMRICFAMIDTADVVAFLPGYRLSAGAQLELQYCFYIDKDVKRPDDEAEGPPVLSQQNIYELVDLRAYYARITALPDCNACRRKCSDCEYLPQPGQATRINCPLYEKETKEVKI